MQIINIDFDKYDKELLELSFMPKQQRDREYLKVAVDELTEIRDGYIKEYGITAELLRLEERILNYAISLKEAEGKDFLAEKKSLEFLMTLKY
ncbi:MAG: hypothetical protein N4A57_07960 [Anaeromicrobium sp.]|jgi:hypothetical protein|uniref:hypothetical protein n=1 Tax=Anaeromicrobium sp. TaxID=1929132 RepID=UPI0025D7EA65|nr:hypothetical protein [Anaeromicrobium sp.]MCT4594185.1 hypothetical protein [Anaeromicrobium sp.]